MKLELVRTYFPYGTNGELYLSKSRVCSTVELPWLDNHARYSCIPEGEYLIRKRYSSAIGFHLELMNVPGRKKILILSDVQGMNQEPGYITPVSILTGEGRGSRSELAFAKFYFLVCNHIDDAELTLTISQQLSP